MRVFVSTALSVLLTLSPSFAAAQAPAAPPPPPTQEATAEVAFVGTTGQCVDQHIVGRGEHIARPASWLIRNRARSFVTSQTTS